MDIRSWKRLTKLGVVCLAGLITAPPSLSYGLDGEMVNFFSRKVVEHVCSDGGKWLECYQVDPAKCSPVINALVSPCSREILGPITTISADKEAAMKTALSFQGCFNDRFDKIFGKKKLSGLRCQEGPAHLKQSKQAG